MGGIVSNHNGPVDSTAGSEENPAADHRITQEEKRSADGDELALKRITGQARNGAGAHQGKNGAVNRKEGELFPDLFSPTEKEHVSHGCQQADRADEMDRRRREDGCKESNIADMAGQKEPGADIETEFQKIISCCVQYQRCEADPAARIQADGSNQGKRSRAERAADLEGCRQFKTKVFLIMEKEGKTEKQAYGANACNPPHGILLSRGLFRSSRAAARSLLKTVHWTVFRARRTPRPPSDLFLTVLRDPGHQEGVHIPGFIVSVPFIGKGL